ncbi:MAG: bifunctional oligoribonuclease/PAP phosphatase NrnA [Christensenella sp.]|nr:MAG: bifunctional oligoribonuclease/PAP phosphatase NrnA [Christensenella sp.]
MTDNFATKQAILDKIKAYDTIIITRHFRPDGDAIGSTKGLQRILALTYPQKRVLLINEDSSDYLAFLGGEDKPVSDEEYKDALVIVCDTATTDRISNKKFALGKEIVKIDHHIESDRTEYGDVKWVEEERSSLCEMIADFYNTFKSELVIDSLAATYIFTGMVTDTGRFKYSSVNGETMRLAGLMLDQGIDTEWVYANLNLDEFEVLKFESYVYKKMRVTQNGVAYIYVDKKMQRSFRSPTSKQATL